MAGLSGPFRIGLVSLITLIRVLVPTSPPPFTRGCHVTNPFKDALTALADVLAKRPAEEILFEWFRSGRLVGELSVLIKRRHPEVQAEIDRVYQEHLAQLSKRRRDPAALDN